ncbi:LuxR C-terminal-related transcriptional regulator [Sphingomonas paucimobilis]|uniref:AAA family ATPase n=1 Tax=Sphingomonas paucimobilis TaxID=13689 RepID=A0A7Y2KS49_SPHPI|nr:LuxR C-terminal-related transcriptional regulator [Sphingomonas paucimobilis]NNG58597.1 AAA family ATPase [Sphingomonas paucimobilis]
MPYLEDAGDAQRLYQFKLEAPRLLSSIVHRGRLITALDAVSSTKLILLTAPAGFGKTTLLSQWREHLTKSRGHVGWLTLDESDADVRRFMAGVILGLQTIGIDMPQLAAQAERGLIEATIKGVIGELQTKLAEDDHKVTLVIDDYHRASSPALDAFVGQWISLLPERVRILMSTRASPDASLRRLLASGQAVEITSDMLRFTLVESRQMLDVGLDEAHRDTLAERIEGWPAALQLARLITLQNRGQEQFTLDRLAAHGGQLWNLLSDQVLRGQTDEIVDFLLETSIFERFSIEISDKVRQRRDTWRIIERLSPLQPLMTPLDAEATWYRYHHLFAEYLQAQLRRRRPADFAALHLRASVAFEEAGLLEEAVRHAGQAGDYARCAELVEQAGGWRLVLFGGAGLLRRLLDFIPLRERLSHPRLLVAQSYAELKTGLVREARSTFNLVSPDVDGIVEDWSRLDERDRDILNINMLLRTYEDNGLDASFPTFSTLIAERMPGVDGLTRGVLDCSGAIASLCLGKFDVAEAFARRAMEGMRSVNSMVGLNYCFLHAGLASAYRGELRSASAYLEHARTMATENFGADSGLKALSETLLAYARYWIDGRPLTTAEDLRDAFRHVCEYDGWFEVYAAGLDVRFRIAWSAMDLAGMDEVIAEGDALNHSRGLERLASIVEAQRLLRDHAANLGRTRQSFERLDSCFPIGAWRDAPRLWRPYQDVAFALVTVTPADRRDQAIARAQDVLQCAEALGSLPYQVRAILLQAQLLFNQEPERASDHVRRAVRLGAGERIALPFVEQRSLAPLIRQLKRELWDGRGDPLEASFLGEIDDWLISVTTQSNSRLSMLSPREQEVAAELAQGLTNKEIARALDMTEHTVKFHLKRIFGKLGVDRRAHALTALQNDRP